MGADGHGYVLRTDGDVTADDADSADSTDTGQVYWTRFGISACTVGNLGNFLHSTASSAPRDGGAPRTGLTFEGGLSCNDCVTDCSV